jgi:hypothetical protein
VGLRMSDYVMEFDLYGKEVQLLMKEVILVMMSIN